MLEGILCSLSESKSIIEIEKNKQALFAEATFKANSDDEYVGLTTHDVVVNAHSSGQTELFLNSGAYFQMKPRRQDYFSFEQTSTVKVEMANEWEAEVQGCGTIVLSLIANVTKLAINERTILVVKFQKMFPKNCALCAQTTMVFILCWFSVQKWVSNITSSKSCSHLDTREAMCIRL